MDCAGFEHGLADLMGGDVDEHHRLGRIEELRRHAAECESCAGSVDLVELLALPRGDRDIADDPGHAYWDDFDRRLAARIDEDAAATSVPASRRGIGAWWWAAAAVALLAVGVAGWNLSGTPEQGTIARGDAQGAETAEVVRRIARPDAPPAPLDDPPEPDVAPGEAVAEFHDAPDAPVGAASPGNEADSADGEALDAGWYAAWDYEEAAIDPEDPASGEVGADLFPDTTDLDADARLELLRWLKERTS